MSHCIMRQINLKMWETGPVVAEQQRRLQSYKNNVDFSRSGENVNLLNALGANDYTVPQFIKAYKEVSKIGGRFNVDKDKHKKNGTNVMCQTVFTASNDFFIGMGKTHIIDYFKKCYQFHVEKYPGCPVISADIHFDETTPHIHISWLPIYHDTETGKRSFNQKKLQPGKDYFRELQKDFYEYMIAAGYSFEEYQPGKKYLDLDEYKLKIEAEKELLRSDPPKQIEYREQLLNKSTVSASKDSIVTANEHLLRVNVLEQENKVLKEENMRLQRERDYLKNRQKDYYEMLLSREHYKKLYEKAVQFIKNHRLLSKFMALTQDYREQFDIPREK